MMTLSKKRVYIYLAAIVLVCAVICTIIILSDKSPSRDPVELAKYVNKHESELIELAKQYPDRYANINHDLGVKSIDTRGKDVRYCFSWSFDLPEGESVLYYASDGVVEFSDYTFTDNATIEGLGVNGKGYIQCTLLKPNWFFIECNIPT